MWIKWKIKSWILMKCCEGRLKLVSSLCLVLRNELKNLASGMSNGNELKMFKPFSEMKQSARSFKEFFFFLWDSNILKVDLLMFHHLIIAGVEGIGVVHAVELISRFGIVLEFVGKCHRVNMLLNYYVMTFVMEYLFFCQKWLQAFFVCQCGIFFFGPYKCVSWYTDLQ